MRTVRRLLGACLLIVFLAVAFTPLPNRLSAWYGVPPRIAHADAIVVLGAGLTPNGNLHAGSLVRATEGIRLYERGLAPLLVLLGTGSEASKRADLALQLGVPPQAVVTEARAYSTGEEARLVKLLLADRGARELLLVTNSLHMRRAEALFDHEGFRVRPAPADDFANPAASPESRLALMRHVVREIGAGLYYRTLRRL